MTEIPVYHMGVKEVFKELKTNKHGLKENEAKKRRVGKTINL